MKLRLIPAGKFTMGSPEDEPEREDDEGPTHPVRITQAFYLGMHEVTQQQFEQVMEGNPAEFSGKDHPVENVPWEDAVEFCRRLGEQEKRNYRLPTEAEWEYAARAGTTSPWYFGDAAGKLKEYAWFAANSGRHTRPVGRRKPNDWGLHDMHGNVWEWCADWYDAQYYAVSPTADPVCTGRPDSADESYRVYRGGGWAHSPRQCRSANRPGYAPGYRAPFLGFRVALDTASLDIEAIASTNE